MEVPLPWERLLWSGHSFALRSARYFLTDFRLVSIDGRDVDEIALYDVASVQRLMSVTGRLVGRSTLIVRPSDPRRSSIVLRHVRRGEQLAAVLEILAGETQVADPVGIRAALSSAPWQLRSVGARYRDAIIGVAAVLTIVFGVAIGLHGKSAAVVYPADDAIYPGGTKRDHEAIVRFMETAVMPWAKTALAPLVGGADHVTCESCHGQNSGSRNWEMPGVAELPKPDMADRGWEQYSTTMDAQMRNAIYGYIAESDNQSRAKYMREIVMPGMAALLHRPPYNFTQNYEFNRTRAAFGCYHCHQVR